MTQLELFMPLKKGVTQMFGANPEYYKKNFGVIGHNGIDYRAADGDTLYATHDGVVTFTGEDGAGGLGVVIRTDREYEYKDGSAFFKTISWHVKTNTFKVKPGDVVKAGDPIACADNTGKSTGCHLHFGLKPIKQGEADWQWYNIEQDNGYMGAIDPSPYFNDYFAEDAKKVVGNLEQQVNILQKAIQAIKNFLSKQG